MQIKEIISDVARAKNDLASLALDGVTPERLARCESTVLNLETIAAEILREAWVPRTVTELTAAIYCVRQDMRWVQSQIDSRIDNLIDRAQPDEFLRMWIAMAFGRLLEHELDVLMNAQAKIMPQMGWTN